ncbi:MAG: hypothetical protein RLN60_01215 [Phycisphaerales bacterium]
MKSTERWWRLSRFWSALDNLADLATVDAEWRSLLGEEYELARALLTCDGREVQSYPRIGDGSGRAPYDLVAEDDGRRVAVDPSGGDPLVLTVEDVRAHLLDLPKLARLICTALGFDCDRRLQQYGPGVCRRIGAHRPTNATRCPVYLCIRQDIDEQIESIRRLLSLNREPFILLTPRHLDDADIEHVLRARSVCHLPLCDVIGINDESRMGQIEPADRLLAEFQPVVEVFERGDAQREPFVFRRLGEAWMLVYEGEPTGAKDRKGLQYIHHVLTHAPKDHHVSEIVATCSGEDAVRSTGSAGEVLDSDARKEYRNRFESLQIEHDKAVKDNDESRKDSIQHEIDALVDELSSAEGLGGRVREGSSDTEHLRVSVKNAIDRAIKAIAPWHPALGAHLDSSISTGQFICYRPDRPIPWSL